MPLRQTEGKDILADLVRDFIKISNKFRDIFAERVGYCFQVPIHLSFFSIGEELKLPIPLQISYPLSPPCSPAVNPQVEHQVDMAILDSSNELERNNVVLRIKWEKEQKLKKLELLKTRTLNAKEKELSRIQERGLQFLEEKEKAIDDRLTRGEREYYKKQIVEMIKKEITLIILLSVYYCEITGIDFSMLKSPDLEYYVKRYERISGLTKKGVVDSIVGALPDRASQKEEKIRETIKAIVRL